MYQTNTMNVADIAYLMRKMEIGDEIGLAQTEDGEYSYGIRRLPGEMFDNGKLWVADYYGGGAAVAFSEGQFDDEDELPGKVYSWLLKNHLLVDGENVHVQVKDGTLPETKWKFEQVDVKPKNRMVCVNFDLRRPFHTYVSVPPDATDGEVKAITRTAVCKLTWDNFKDHVIASDVDLDPFIDLDDFTWMEVDSCCNQQNADTTDLPTGTIGR